VTSLPAGFPPLPAEVAAALGQQVVRATPLAGGSIAQVWRAELADGSPIVVKATDYDARLEADGLDALRAAGGPPPRVHAATERMLVLEHVRGPGDARRLGADVATIHRAVGPAFGWDRDNVIGPLPQPNPRDPDWPSFYATQRIAPYLDDLPAELAARLEAAIEDGQMARLLDHDVTPSLVHGDLWSGNVIDHRWLIDPAVHHADRELDLAMLELFGGLSPAFVDGYEQVWPLDEGWRDRRPALQLYHLLVHVRLFGAGYVGAFSARLYQLGW
jgi:fructosamine-3-kinase